MIILPGWANNGLDVNDTEVDVATVHSGLQSLEWNPGASDEGMTYQMTALDGAYLYAGVWHYGDGADSISFGAEDATEALLHESATAFEVEGDVAARWTRNVMMLRAAQANPKVELEASAGAAGDRFTDDVFVIPMDSVAVTFTPSSEVNSQEGTGIRIDGHGQGVQAVPPGVLGANFGMAIFPWTPRHDDVEMIEFGIVQPYLARYWGDATNYFEVLFTAANTMQVRFNAAAAGLVNAVWATGGAFFVPGVQHTIMVIYDATHMWLYVDGVIRATINAPTGFTTLPANAYYGSRNGGDWQIDAVYG